MRKNWIKSAKNIIVTIISPADNGKIAIDTVTAISAGGKIGSHHFSGTSDGGIKMDIWNAVATILEEE